MAGQRPVARRTLVLPFGGAVEVARSYLKVHTRNPWTGRCRGCGERHPCWDRRQASRVVDAVDPEVEPHGWLVALLALPTLAGLVLIALAAVGLIP